MTEKAQQRTYTAAQVVAFVRRYGSRMQLARDIGQHTAFEDQRKYYDVLGYPKSITIQEYSQRYNRQDIAGRVVDLPAQDTWRKPPKISEDGNTETEFAQAWDDLTKSDLGVWGKLSRADKLSGIGRFGILLLGVADGVEKLEEPVNKEALNGIEDLLYLRPIPEGDTRGERVRILEFEDDHESRRFGLPTMYEVKLLHNGGDFTKIHWSRIIHLAENKRDDEVYGTPRLERIYNRLDDLIKFVGGGAEATWMNMRPGTHFAQDKDFDTSEITDEYIEEQIENYAHDPMRILFLEGYEAKQIGTSEVVDSSALFDSTLALIATVGIPQRVLVGSALGEAASAEWDQKQWAGEVDFRQTNYAGTEILRPFINRLIDFGILPEPKSGSYDIGVKDSKGEWHWPMLLEQTDSELAEIQHRRAQSAAVLSDPMAEYPIDENEKRELVGFPPEEKIEQEPGSDIRGDVDMGDVEEAPAEKVIEGVDAVANRMIMRELMYNVGDGQIPVKVAAQFARELVSDA
jgi:hypothetical protein